jgi:hypothetical protein
MASLRLYEQHKSRGNNDVQSSLFEIIGCENNGAQPSVFEIIGRENNGAQPSVFEIITVDLIELVSHLQSSSRS